MNSQDLNSYYFDFEDVNISCRKPSDTSGYHVQFDNAIMRRPLPKRNDLAGFSVIEGYSYSDIEYKDYNVGDKFLVHSTTWFLYPKKEKGRAYNHIEIVLKDSLPKGNYYNFSFLAGNYKSFMYKPSSYGIKFSDKRILKSTPQATMSEPNLLFSFKNENELEYFNSLVYAENDIKYIYMGIFKEDSLLVNKTHYDPRLLRAITRGKIDSFPDTRPTRLIIDNIKIQKLQKKAKMFSDLYFGFDKYQTNSTQSKNSLKKIANYLSANPDYNIFIYGYTDDIGTVKYNQKLSLKRANFIKNKLIKLGVNRDKIMTYGKGINKSKNTTDKLSRKVSFTIFE